MLKIEERSTCRICDGGLDVVFDLGEISAFPPTPDEAYQACLAATYSNHQQGRIGAGTGATIGKLIPHATHMNGGLGCAEIVLDNSCVRDFPELSVINDFSVLLL